MSRQTYELLNITLLSFFVLFASGCTLKASTESVTDATTNFLSSTTPGAWFTVDGLLKPSEKINAFLATNYENLQQDMAQGEGEYLTALGTLLQILDEELSTFKALTQDHVQQIDKTIRTNPKNLLALLSNIKSESIQP